MKQQSTFFIKPEAKQFTQQIGRRISLAGLKIVEQKEVTLTEEILRVLYARLTESLAHQLLFEQNVQQLKGKVVLAAIVEGEFAVERLTRIIGESTNPLKCPKGSLRHDLAKQLGWKPIPCGPFRYWPNGIHRAKSNDEVKRDLRILFGK